MLIHKHSHNRKGFGSAEFIISLVVTIVASCVAFAIINSQNQFAKTKNTKRRLDVHSIAMSLYEYTLAHGKIPDTITTNETMICKEKSLHCGGFIDLSFLVQKNSYLYFIPTDPDADSEFSSGYTVYRNPNNTFTISAPHAQNGEKISETR